MTERDDPYETRTAVQQDPEADEGRPRRLVVLGGAAPAWFELPPSGTSVLGRAADADFRIDGPSVSRRHAALHVGQAITVEDLGSANGTWVGPRRLVAKERVPLPRGTLLQLGSTVLAVELAPAAASQDAPSHEGARLVETDTMRPLLSTLERVAAGDIAVLVLGETGSGKEVIAQRVHELSPRAKGPFLKINCAALPESLLESELFGYERGAFTGAVRAKPGLFESAAGGTVFLDEIGDLPLPLQAKLLGVLEDGRVLRVGSLKPRPLDVRFVAATHRELEADTLAGRFRQDLFFRLSGVVLVVPPLRARRDEIEPLARALAEQAATRLGRKVPSFQPDALALFDRYGWPGNIRELKSVVERAVLLSDGAPIGVAHLPADRMTAPAVVPAPPGARPSDALRDALADAEKRTILDAIERHGGNQTKAAKALGIARRTIVKRLAEYREADRQATRKR